VDIFVDGRRIRSTPRVSADVTAAPQSVAIPLTLPPGSHKILIRTEAPGARAYLLGSTWHGRSDSTNSFAVIGPEGYGFDITIPGSTVP
jgi:hypothetical protein